MFCRRCFGWSFNVCRMLKKGEVECSESKKLQLLFCPLWCVLVMKDWLCPRAKLSWSPKAYRAFRMMRSAKFTFGSLLTTGCIGALQI
jgi:hypothetical protein